MNIHIHNDLFNVLYKTLLHKTLVEKWIRLENEGVSKARMKLIRSQRGVGEHDRVNKEELAR